MKADLSAVLIECFSVTSALFQGARQIVVVASGSRRELHCTLEIWNCVCRPVLCQKKMTHLEPAFSLFFIELQSTPEPFFCFRPALKLFGSQPGGRRGAKIRHQFIRPGIFRESSNIEAATIKRGS